jgi:hypothetical protein
MNLKREKRKLHHGEWERWVKKNLNFSSLELANGFLTQRQIRVVPIEADAADYPHAANSSASHAKLPTRPPGGLSRAIATLPQAFVPKKQAQSGSVIRSEVTGA